LASVGIADPVARLHHYPHELSGGMRQRVMIGMAVACRPKLLILDEPTTALDVTVQAQVITLIRELKEQLGFAVLFITHNLDLAAEFCDRAIVMYGGEIVEEAPVDVLFDVPRHPYSRALLDCVPRLGSRGRSFSTIPGQPPAPGVLAAGCAFAPRCGLTFDRCQRERPTLHEVGAGHRVACLAAPEPVRGAEHAVPG
jgi:oligopeptide/dipeptide ABC transporter ATP-binding protein